MHEAECDKHNALIELIMDFVVQAEDPLDQLILLESIAVGIREEHKMSNEKMALMLELMADRIRRGERD